MCYTPNIMIGKKFCGGMKKFCKEKGWDNDTLKRKLEEGEAKIIPCGQCLECRLNYAKNWAARCEVESYYYKENEFITLTYDDEHVPVINKITGEVYRGLKNPIAYYNYGKHYEVLNLFKKDVQDFLKRLRKAAGKAGYIEDEEFGIRYFYCGEYGTNKHRPHYHMIVYGLHIPDLKFKYAKKGYQHFTSEWLQKIWGNGLVDIGGVDYESCQYVARYVVKKQKGTKAREWYKQNGLMPEFINMSLKPGIGIRYYEEHRDEIYSKDLVYLKKGRRQKPPKAFDLKEDIHCLAEESGQTMTELEKKYGDAEALNLLRMQSFKMRELKRERRKKSLDSLFAQLQKTTAGILQYFETKGSRYEERHKISLQRAGGDAEE